MIECERNIFQQLWNVPQTSEFILRMVEHDDTLKSIDTEIMPFGSLASLSKENLIVNEETFTIWIVESLRGLDFLGNQQLIHTDIKP